MGKKGKRDNREIGKIRKREKGKRDKGKKEKMGKGSMFDSNPF